MIQKFRDTTLFFREFCGRFETTGSIIPSSRFLAQAITRRLARRGAAPVRVLECGPGTGAFTNQIVGHLRPHDTFDVVELNGAFVQALRSRMATESRWQAVAGLTTIYQVPFQEFTPQAPYDFIISGLPHINFPESLVAEIIASYSRLLKPGGTLSYFEYMYIRPIRKAVTLGIDRHRVREVDCLMNSHLRRHDVSRDSIFLNLPPAWVQHLTQPAENNRILHISE
jgi:phosphatidylethanolamine/phosphatidyl-N-methylethanolamine N-methyltransferase